MCDNLNPIVQDLKDGYNFGFYIPPENLKAGKFLDECRKLSEYPLSGSIGNLEVRALSICGMYAILVLLIDNNYFY